LTTFVGSLAMMVHTPAGIPLVDRAALSVISMHTDTALNTLMTALTSFGGELTLICTFVALVGWAYATRGVWWARFFVLVMSGALAFDNIIKPLVGRPRPIFDQLVNGRGPSWPSGHTTGTTALLVALAIYAAAGRGRTARLTVWVVALAGSIVMGATRVYLGVHWPSDVLAGLVLGTAWATVCAHLLKVEGMPQEQSPGITTRRALVPLTVTLAFVAVAFTPH
jgi:membrane-associated phospholipid phosphatase